MAPVTPLITIKLSQNPQPALRLAPGFLDTRARLIMITPSLPLVILPLPMPLIILRCDGLDLRGAPPQQHGVAADILPLHVPRGLEEVVAVAETHEPVALA